MNTRTHYCRVAGHDCNTAYECSSADTACKLVCVNESGRKVAHGRAIEFKGKEAEELPISMEPSLWDDFLANLMFWGGVCLVLFTVAFTLALFFGINTGLAAQFFN